MNDESIFAAALQKSPGNEREAYLDEMCGDDQRRRKQIAELLASHDQSNSLLDGDLTGGLDAEALIGSTIDATNSKHGKGNEQIGSYRLLHLLGEGGMGSVYMAEQTRPVRRRVAVKIIKQGLNSAQFTARFEAERQAIAMMDHPNIAKVLDAGCTENGDPFFVMELVKGVPITDFCDQNKISTEGRLELFIQVCNAVQHAHQKGIIHRDLKPSNVMVAMYDDKAVPKVIDFGVAKATHQPLTEQTLYTVPGQIVGTWEYMSPEQAILNQLDVDTRTDIYSLGVILYELLTGHTPLDLKSLQPGALEERLRRIREEEPSRPSFRVSSLGAEAGSLATYRGTEAKSLTQSLRGDLDWIVMKAIEKDRSKRYETANGFAGEINRFLNDEPISFRPPSNWAQFGRFYRRNRAVVTSALLTTGSLLLGLSLALWQYSLANNRAQNLTQKESELRTKLEEIAIEKRTAEERLGIVKDYTMLLARSGDQKDLELAISVSNMVGASDLWRRMLRAQGAIELGTPEKAIEILSDLPKGSDSEITQCKALKATAAIFAGLTDEHLRLQRALQQIDPTSPEELIFVGQGIMFDSKTWLRMAEEAFEIRESYFARMNRAAAAMMYSIDFGDLRVALRALEDVQSLTEAVPETPYLISLRAQCLLATMILAEQEGQNIEKWKPDILKDISTLQSYPEYGWGLLVTAWYHDHFAPEIADDSWSRLLNDGPGGWMDLHAAAVIHRQHSFEHWREKLTGSEILEKQAFAGLHALEGTERGRQEALQTYDSTIETVSTVSFRSGTGFGIALVAKDLARLKRDANRLLQQADFLSTFDREVTLFLAQQATYESMEMLLEKSQRNEQLLGYFMLGLYALAEDNVPLARKYFELCRSTGVFHTSDYYWARSFLEVLPVDIHPNDAHD